VSEPARDWFNDLARFLGPAYLRNAFTKGTEQEVAFLVDALALTPPMRVLDVGCGPGRHALAFARRGFRVTGVDLSPDFIALARDVAAAEHLDVDFVEADARDLDADGAFDLVVSLCQGAFGLLGGADDGAIPARLVRALVPGGRLAIETFHSYFALAHLEAGEEFDPTTGLVHDRATLRDPSGIEARFEMWTTCFTAREMGLLVAAAGATVDGTYGVEPGAYAATPPNVNRPSLLLLGTKV
jgi:SAM-dependent methyltransferase